MLDGYHRPRVHIDTVKTDRMIVNNPGLAWGWNVSMGKPMDLSLFPGVPDFDGLVDQRDVGIIAPFDLAIERELWRWIPAEVALHLARTHY